MKHDLHLKMECQRFQVVLGIFGLYTSLYFVSKLLSGKKKETTSEVSSSGNNNDEIPSIESPDFDKWIAVPGNAEKLFA
jgi:hypothetical protein